MPVLLGHEIRKQFRRDTGDVVKALDGVSLTAEEGTLTALVGPDGAGKTTLIRLIAGLISPDSGELKVLDIDVAKYPQQVQNRIGYMPQRFGLYEDLSVRENMDLYADLHGVTAEQRREKYPQLMSMTGLGRFTERLAGRLSGGMKQKLGLACTLVRAPDLLLLDEPTVGVDPLSRQELWEIILKLVHEQKLTVLISTSYLDEAERCGHVIVMQEGKVLTQGPPGDVTRLAMNHVFLIDPDGRKARDLQAELLDEPGVVDALPYGGQVRVVRSGEISDQAPLPLSSEKPTPPRFEDGFMVLLRQKVGQKPVGKEFRFDTGSKPNGGNGDRTGGDQVVVKVDNLVRKFGDFTAVDHVSFEVHRGEIFGLLGPNGAGKTTTFRMLCGLLGVTDGTLKVAGVDLRYARASARQKLGYVAQKFSLYGQLSVTENLDFFASAYGLRNRRRRERINWALQEFELSSMAKVEAGQLPGGFRQRLAMAAALLHEPEILFLDEPTSGADPLARREFWRRITALSQQSVTVIVTTHFMEEAEYCDHIAIMDSGKVLAQGEPADIRGHAKSENGREPTMADAFIAIVEEARNRNSNGHAIGGAA
jgi:ABC-2 type transport system ATP-binding protein